MEQRAANHRDDDSAAQASHLTGIACVLFERGIVSCVAVWHGRPVLLVMATGPAQNMILYCDIEVGQDPVVHDQDSFRHRSADPIQAAAHIEHRLAAAGEDSQTFTAAMAAKLDLTPAIAARTGIDYLMALAIAIRALGIGLSMDLHHRSGEEAFLHVVNAHVPSITEAITCHVDGDKPVFADQRGEPFDSSDLGEVADAVNQRLAVFPGEGAHGQPRRQPPRATSWRTVVER